MFYVKNISKKLLISKCYFNKLNHRLLHSQAIRQESWESIIGLEVHAQISSNTKLFSRADTNFTARVNNQVGFFDAALPGTLPVINKKCVEAAVLTALALNCKVNHVSLFDRKHYFYSDLPAGFQITQQRKPIAAKGHLAYIVQNGTEFTECTARITQLQLEQDSGKSLHDNEESLSLIDLNRAGVALMEIVTEPDFRSGLEAAAFVKELQAILQSINTCDGKMEEGSLRVDASVSLRKPGQPLGIRTEVKNISSTKFIANAIEYEINRQMEILESGGEILNETRSFDYQARKTLPMRDKEKLHDYRFMPEPNLPPLRLYDNQTLCEGVDPSQIVNIDTVCEQLPELPSDRRVRLTQQYGLSMLHIMRMQFEPGMPEYFESVMRIDPSLDPVKVANLIINKISAFINDDDITFLQCPLQPEQTAEVINLWSRTVIKSSTVPKVLEMLYKGHERSAEEAVRNNNLSIINDADEIERICKTVLQKSSDKLIDGASKGKSRPFKALCIQIQNKSGDRIPNEIVSRTLKKLLKTS